jgi:hypothetical protein
MHVARKHIRLGVSDPSRSAAFYQALLDAAPTSDVCGSMVLESDSPPVVLVLNAARRTRAPAGEAFALVVTEPEHVGKAAVALWRAGARMRLEDACIETHDPDGNAWSVRFEPGAKERAILALPGESRAEREKR